MKNIVLFVILFALASVACSKNVAVIMDQSVVGKWKWMYSVGGFTGKDTVKPGTNTTMLIFNPNHTYEKVVNGTTVAQGMYTIVNVKSIFTGTSAPAIRFDNADDNHTLLIEMDGAQLILSDNHVEPYGQVYERMK